MHESVRAVWLKFNEPFEGRVPHMYLDIRGLVTVGVGNLIDPAGMALSLPWQLPGGLAASREVVMADWHAIKSRQDLRKRHYREAAPVTRVRLTDEAIDALVMRRLESNVRIVASEWPEWHHFPADAQLGILSMAWAMGATFYVKFPKFSAAVRAQDWATAARECAIRSTNNPGVIPRNTANRLCFRNASTLETARREVYWPHAAAIEGAA